MNHPLSEERRAAQLLWFALPTVMMMLSMGLYTVTDTIFVSRFAGTDALAALNLVTPAVNLTVGLSSMLASGGSALAARSMGEQQAARANAEFSQIVCASVLFALLLGAGTWNLDRILHLLGASERLWGDCRAYLGTLLPFLPAAFLQTLFASFFVAAGRPGLGSALSLAAGAINLALDLLFLSFCKWGIAGAALGTGLGQLLPALAGLFFFARRGEPPALRAPSRSWRVLAKACTNGSSELVGQLAAAITTCLLNRAMLALCGEDGVAALTILIYAQFFFSTAFLGFSMGVAPILSYQFGAGNPAVLRRTVLDCLRLIVLCSGCGCFAAWVGSGWLTGLFAAPESSVYSLAAEGLRLFSLSFLFCGVNLFSSALFTALSDGKTSAFLSFLRTFVFSIAGILLLPKGFGVRGLWLAVPCAEGGAAVVALACLYRLLRGLSNAGV